jgi:hypothetical protein
LAASNNGVLLHSKQGFKQYMSITTL